MFFFCLLYSLILQCSTRVKPQEMTCFVAFIMTSLSLPHGYIPLPVSEILFFAQIPWISFYYFDFLLWQIFLDYSFLCEFFVISILVVVGSH